MPAPNPNRKEPDHDVTQARATPRLPQQVPQATLAERSDRYVLYQRSVQDADWEIGFMTDTYKGMRGRCA